jgi:hypothetical protein
LDELLCPLALNTQQPWLEYNGVNAFVLADAYSENDFCEPILVETFDSFAGASDMSKHAKGEAAFLTRPVRVIWDTHHTHSISYVNTSTSIIERMFGRHVSRGHNA